MCYRARSFRGASPALLLFTLLYFAGPGDLPSPSRPTYRNRFRVAADYCSCFLEVHKSLPNIPNPTHNAASKHPRERKEDGLRMSRHGSRGSPITIASSLLHSLEEDGQWLLCPGAPLPEAQFHSGPPGCWDCPPGFKSFWVAAELPFSLRYSNDPLYCPVSQHQGWASSSHRVFGLN